MSANESVQPPPRTRRQIALTTLAAFVASLFVVVGVILPAEFSVDPLGTGKLLGVLGLAEDGSDAVVTYGAVHKNDRVSFQLAPFESVEYSYRMQRGATLVYSWQASGGLVFNLHSTPDLPFSEGTRSPGEAGVAESFSNGRAEFERGVYIAPFTGQHGWFWENRDDQEVTLELATSGFFGESLRSSVSGQETGSPGPAL